MYGRKTGEDFHQHVSLVTAGVTPRGNTFSGLSLVPGVSPPGLGAPRILGSSIFPAVLPGATRKVVRTVPILHLITGKAASGQCEVIC